MKRTLLLTLVLTALVATAALAETRIQVNIGLAPPPPAVVFHAPPPMAYAPGPGVYYVDRPGVPYDCFRYGVFFYIYNDGWWYRSRRYNGPFVAVEERFVPRPIWNVPGYRWRQHPHGMPPGQAKKYYGDDRGRGRGWGEGHGNGHGHGHDRDRH